jgi:hypothetical protein
MTDGCNHSPNVKLKRLKLAADGEALWTLPARTLLGQQDVDAGLAETAYALGAGKALAQIRRVVAGGAVDLGVLGRKVGRRVVEDAARLHGKRVRGAGKAKNAATAGASVALDRGKGLLRVVWWCERLVQGRGLVVLVGRDGSSGLGMVGRGWEGDALDGDGRLRDLGRRQRRRTYSQRGREGHEGRMPGAYRCSLFIEVPRGRGSLVRRYNQILPAFAKVGRRLGRERLALVVAGPQPVVDSTEYFGSGAPRPLLLVVRLPASLRDGRLAWSTRAERPLEGRQCRGPPWWGTGQQRRKDIARSAQV